MKLKVSLLVISVTLSCACGYHLTGRAKSLPRDAHSIYVSEFPNRSTRLDAPAFVRRSLIDELDGTSRLRVVSSLESADLVLEGEIENCRISPVSKNIRNRDKTYTFGIQLSMRLIDRRNQKILSENENIGFRQNCSLDFTDLSVSSGRELRTLAADFAAFILDALLENF